MLEHDRTRWAKTAKRGQVQDDGRMTTAARAPGCQDPGWHQDYRLPRRNPQFPHKSYINIASNASASRQTRMMARFCVGWWPGWSNIIMLSEKKLRPEPPIILYCRMIGPSVGWYHPKIIHHPGFTYMPAYNQSRAQQHRNVCTSTVGPKVFGALKQAPMHSWTVGP